MRSISKLLAPLISRRQQSPALLNLCLTLHRSFNFSVDHQRLRLRRLPPLLLRAPNPAPLPVHSLHFTLLPLLLFFTDFNSGCTSLRGVLLPCRLYHVPRLPKVTLTFLRLFLPGGRYISCHAARRFSGSQCQSARCANSFLCS